MSRRNEEGQVFLLAALMLMVIVGIAAFCVNASFAFYQHQRMQAMVDEQTRYAAGSGCTVSTSTLDGGTLIITPTVFFSQDGRYCDGVYSKQSGGLFGNILRFPNKISVHAIAEHGGTTQRTFAILGLDPGTKSTDCSVNFSGGAGISLDGDILSNSQGTVPLPCNNKNATLTYTYPLTETYISSANAVDPYEIPLPSTGTDATKIVQTCNQTGGCNSTNTASLSCLPSSYTVDKDATYYQPVDTTTAVLFADITTNNDKDNVYLLPFCSGSNTKPGVFLTGSLKGSGGSIHSYDSTIVVTTETGLNISATTKVDWHSPGTGGLTGYALYEYTACTPQNGGTTESINGGSSFSVDGLIDLSCMNLKFSGGSGTAIQAILVAWSIDFTGGSGAVGFKPPTVSPPRGAFLVQ